MESLIIIFVFLLLIRRHYEIKNNPELYTKQKINDSQEHSPNNNYEEYQSHYKRNYMPYAKGKLLTKTEQAFFSILVKEALKRRLLVCPKVRLEDIIYVTDYRNKLKYRGYIKSRHVDFVLINTFCETVAAVELDDPSHNTTKAAEIDQFKNELFYNVGIPLIRICTGTDYKKEINYAFDELKFPKTELQKTQP